MTTENSNGGSRMKALQEGGEAQQAAAPKAPAASRAKRPAAAAAAPEIDYNKLADALAPRMASIMAPIMRTGGVSTEGMEVGQMPDIILGDGTLVTGGVDLAAIDTPLESDYFKALAFMEEEIQVMVHETDDPNAENPIIVGNNGIFKEFFRGHTTVAKRKFVDGLIVKSSRVTTPEKLNKAGERCNVIEQHSAHKYSFSVVQDRNPKGAEWLRRRMAEAV